MQSFPMGHSTIISRKQKGHISQRFLISGQFIRGLMSEEKGSSGHSKSLNHTPRYKDGRETLPGLSGPGATSKEIPQLSEWREQDLGQVWVEPLAHGTGPRLVSECPPKPGSDSSRRGKAGKGPLGLTPSYAGQEWAPLFLLPARVARPQRNSQWPQVPAPFWALPHQPCLGGGHTSPLAEQVSPSPQWGNTIPRAAPPLAGGMFQDHVTEVGPWGLSPFYALWVPRLQPDK